MRVLFTSCKQRLEPLLQLLWLREQVAQGVGPAVYQTTDTHEACYSKLVNVHWYLASVMWKYKTKAPSQYCMPWLCLSGKYQQTKLFASCTVIKCYHRDQSIMTEFTCLPQGICMVAFNHITSDAGVMLLLLDVIYLASQMLIWQHYSCQKIIYFCFFVCAVRAAFYCFCMCVCMCAPARCSRNDGTQVPLCPGKVCLNNQTGTVCCMSFLRVYFMQDKP